MRWEDIIDGDYDLKENYMTYFEVLIQEKP